VYLVSFHNFHGFSFIGRRHNPVESTQTPMKTAATPTIWAVVPASVEIYIFLSNSQNKSKMMPAIKSSFPPKRSCFRKLYTLGE
jgi:hypothetical protein